MMLLLLLTACLPELGVESGETCTLFPDNDGDGFGIGDGLVRPCGGTDGFTDVGGDCDDQDPSVFPGAVEECDDIDGNCDGVADEPQDWFPDADQDGWGAGAAFEYCADPGIGWAELEGDCDDQDPTINPDAVPECNDGDRNCDGIEDNADEDGDGFAGCEECDDTLATVNPDASEICDGLDNDCDGAVDTEDDSLDVSTQTAWYEDADGDGYGNPSQARYACDAMSGHVADSQDCDDNDNQVNPDGEEVCNSKDDDCDGTTDGIVYLDTDFSTDTHLVRNGSAYHTYYESLYYEVFTYDEENQAGSAMFPTPVSTHRLHAEFVMGIGYNGYYGADGMTFAMLDTIDTAVLGEDGYALGVEGYLGHAIEFDTYNNGGGDPNGNHIALVDTEDLKTHLDYTEMDDQLSDGDRHTVLVTLEDGAFTASYDGEIVVDATVPDYAIDEVLVGWTASTGGSTDYHWVNSATISCPSP